MDAALSFLPDRKSSPAAPAPRVAVLRGARAMAEAVPAWEDLAAHALEPNPFHEPWMLLPALESFARADEDVGIVTVWISSKLGALLPVRRVRLASALPPRVLATWSHKHSMLGTPLVRSGTMGAESLRCLVQWLAADGDGACALELERFPAGGAFHASLVAALNEEQVAALTTQSYTRAVLRRGADAESYIGSALSRSTRRTLERKEARLRSQGALAYRALAPQDDLEAWIDDFLRLEARGWKGQARSAMACSDVNRRFARTVMTEAFRRGRLMMNGIDFDGRPIARLWCFLAGEGSYGFKTAYDEEFKSYMPGFMAELHNIREFHRRPDLQWMDSYTDAGNTVMDRLWKHRLVVQSVLIGARGFGALWANASPLLRWAKQRLARSA